MNESNDFRTGRLVDTVSLNELDWELENRGHSFCRYADGCNIYVCSEQPSRRVMESIKRFFATRLKLQKALDYR